MSPQTGYPDWQRNVNFDSGLLWNVNTVLTNQPTTSPTLDVSKFAYLAGLILITNNPALVTITWYADSGRVTTLGQRQFILTNSIASSSQIRLVNLGPFCQVQISSISGTQYQASAQLFLSNRVHPLEFIPTQKLLINQQNVAIGANTTVQINPGDYYAGPARVFIFSALTQGWQLQVLSVNNTWDIVDSFNTTANVNAEFDTITPAGAWRMQIFNAGGASNYYLVVTPSMSGSS